MKSKIACIILALSMSLVFVGNADFDSPIIDDDFIERLYLTEYIEDYSAFGRYNVRSVSGGSRLSVSMRTSYVSEYVGDPMNIERVYDTDRFPLVAYSDISKSVNFKLGDREIIEGRFAENIRECNINSFVALLQFGNYRTPTKFN